MKHRDGMFLSTKLWPEQIIITYGHKHKELLSYKVRNSIFYLVGLIIACIHLSFEILYNTKMTLEGIDCIATLYAKSLSDMYNCLRKEFIKCRYLIPTIPH